MPLAVGLFQADQGRGEFRRRDQILKLRQEVRPSGGICPTGDVDVDEGGDLAFDVTFTTAGRALGNRQRNDQPPLHSGGSLLAIPSLYTPSRPRKQLLEV